MLMLTDALQFQDDGGEESGGAWVHAVIMSPIQRSVD